MEVSGVRSSCETIETNSSLRWSSSFCSVMSRSTTTTPTSFAVGPSMTGDTIEWRTLSPTLISSRSGCAAGSSQPRTRSNG